MAKSLRKIGPISKLEIRNKTPGKCLSGASTILLLNGEPLKGARSLKLEIEAGSVAKATIELLADIELDETVINTEMVYEIGEPAPIAVKAKGKKK